MGRLMVGAYFVRNTLVQMVISTMGIDAVLFGLGRRMWASLEPSEILPRTTHFKSQSPDFLDLSFFGDSGGIRTLNQLIKSQLLYH